MAKNILLICGSGASSGFMAANMRKAAKKECFFIKSKIMATQVKILNDRLVLL